MNEKESRTAAQMKLDSHIVLPLKKSRGEPPFEKPTQLDPDPAIEADERVVFDFNATVSKELFARIEIDGGKVINSFEASRAIRALVPLKRMEALPSQADHQIHCTCGFQNAPVTAGLAGRTNFRLPSPASEIGTPPKWRAVDQTDSIAAGISPGLPKIPPLANGSISGFAAAKAGIFEVRLSRYRPQISDVGADAAPPINKGNLWELKICE